MTTIRKLLSVLILHLITVNAYAVVIAAEPFDYPDGSINGQNGGNGWGGAWQGSGNIAGGQLLPGISQQNFRPLGSTISHTAGTSIYVAFDMSAVAGPGGEFTGLSFFNGNTEEVFIGLPFDIDSFGID